MRTLSWVRLETKLVRSKLDLLQPEDTGGNGGNYKGEAVRQFVSTIPSNGGKLGSFVKEEEAARGGGD